MGNLKMGETELHRKARLYRDARQVLMDALHEVNTSSSDLSEPLHLATDDNEFSLVEVWLEKRSARILFANAALINFKAICAIGGREAYEEVVAEFHAKVGV